VGTQTPWHLFFNTPQLNTNSKGGGVLNSGVF